MKALVHTESGTVTDIVADNATFDVHSDYAWKDMISDYVEGTDNPQIILMTRQRILSQEKHPLLRLMM